MLVYNDRREIMVNNKRTDQLIEYKFEDIFTEDESNPDDMLMKIPDEITERMGWKPGDNLKITQDERGNISIVKADNG